MQGQEQEQVLVLGRLAIDRVFHPGNANLDVDVSCIIPPADLQELVDVLQDKDADLCGSGFARFALRSDVEDDPNFVQLIPYIVVTDGLHRSNAKVLTYYRSKKSGEARLKGKRSIGVGGHINPEDTSDGNVYLAAMRREFKEELGVDLDKLQLYSGTDVGKIYGIIRDTKTPVNRVHVGIVHVLHLAEVPAFEFAPCMADPSFEYVHQQVMRDEYEDWSRLALELLDTLPRHVPPTL